MSLKNIIINPKGDGDDGAESDQPGVVAKSRKPRTLIALEVSDDGEPLIPETPEDLKGKDMLQWEKDVVRAFVAFNYSKCQVRIRFDKLPNRNIMIRAGIQQSEGRRSMDRFGGQFRHVCGR